MSLISLLVVLVIAGFVCWLALQVPMAQPFKNVIIGVICLFLVLWLLQQLGLLSGMRLRLN